MANKTCGQCKWWMHHPKRAGKGTCSVGLNNRKLVVYAHPSCHAFNNNNYDKAVNNLLTEAVAIITWFMNRSKGFRERAGRDKRMEKLDAAVKAVKKIIGKTS